MLLAPCLAALPSGIVRREGRTHDEEEDEQGEDDGVQDEPAADGPYAHQLRDPDSPGKRDERAEETERPQRRHCRTSIRSRRIREPERDCYSGEHHEQRDKQHCTLQCRARTAPLL